MTTSEKELANRLSRINSDWIQEVYEKIGIICINVNDEYELWSTCGCV